MLVLGVDIIILSVFGLILVIVSAAMCTILKIANEIGEAIIASSFLTSFLMICAYAATIKVLEFLFGAM